MCKEKALLQLNKPYSLHDKAAIHKSIQSFINANNNIIIKDILRFIANTMNNPIININITASINSMILIFCVKHKENFYI